MPEQRIQQQFIDSADLKYQLAPLLSPAIHAAIQVIVNCLTNGGKVLAGATGASAALAQQWALWGVAGFERERPGLATLALSANAALLAPQVQALGLAGDVLLLFVAPGEEPSALAALQAAQERDLTVLLLCASQATALSSLLQEHDVLLAVPHHRTSRVREVHALMLHCLCDGVDTQLLGEQESFE